MANIIKKSTRDSFGEALVQISKENENIVVLDADLSSSTKTCLFKQAFPERFFNCGISECNMVGVGAGLAIAGKIPFIASFAMFIAGRGFEQIRNSIAYPNLNVKIIGSHAGISVGEDGATHQCCEDIAIMRSIPNMTIFCPCDEFETQAIVRLAVDYVGPTYIRLSRFDVDPVYKSVPEDFSIYKGVELRSGGDITIISTGIVTSYTMKAAVMLERDNIYSNVVHIPTIKPIDSDIIIRLSKLTHHVFTVEEHNIIGGLGEAVAAVLCENCPKLLTRIGIRDEFSQSGSAKDLIHYYKLDEYGIYNSIKQALM